MVYFFEMLELLFFFLNNVLILEMHNKMDYSGTGQVDAEWEPVLRAGA